MRGPEAIDFAVTAHVRHAYTAYDRLLVRGCERHEARAGVKQDVQRLLAQWRAQAGATPSG